MRAVRGLLGVAGASAIAYGLWSMRHFTFDQLKSLVLWLGGGVILHDGVLAPVVVALAVVGLRVLPASMRVPATVGFVLWGTVTVTALAVLSGQGGHTDNPTILNGHYRLAWLVGTAVVALAVVGWSRLGVSRASNTRSD